LIAIVIPILRKYYTTTVVKIQQIRVKNHSFFSDKYN